LSIKSVQPILPTAFLYMKSSSLLEVILSEFEAPIWSPEIEIWLSFIKTVGDHLLISG